MSYASHPHQNNAGVEDGTRDYRISILSRHREAGQSGSTIITDNIAIMLIVFPAPSCRPVWPVIVRDE